MGLLRERLWGHSRIFLYPSTIEDIQETIFYSLSSCVSFCGCENDKGKSSEGYPIVECARRKFSLNVCWMVEPFKRYLHFNCVEMGFSLFFIILLCYHCREYINSVKKFEPRTVSFSLIKVRFESTLIYLALRKGEVEFSCWVYTNQWGFQARGAYQAGSGLGSMFAAFGHFLPRFVCPCRKVESHVAKRGKRHVVSAFHSREERPWPANLICGCCCCCALCCSCICNCGKAYKVKCVGAAICGYCISLICSCWRMSRGETERERGKFGNSREDQLALLSIRPKCFGVGMKSNQFNHWPFRAVHTVFIFHCISL